MNDLRYYTFQHRIPLEKVTTLGICGDVNIEFFGLCEVSKKKMFCLGFLILLSSLSVNVDGISRAGWFTDYFSILT